MLLAPNFPLTPAGYFGAMVYRMLEWLTLRVRRADQGYQPALSPHMRAQTKAIHDRIVLAGRMFARLAELARTGKLRSYPNRASPRPRGQDDASPAAACGVLAHGGERAPHGPGWMLDFVPADFAAHMARLLRIGDMVSLIQTAPPVARLLRPLCRGLGVVAPPGVFPPLPRRPRRPTGRFSRRHTADERSLSPDAFAPEHCGKRVAEAQAGIQRGPRPWGRPDGPAVARPWAEAEARHDDTRRNRG